MKLIAGNGPDRLCGCKGMAEQSVLLAHALQIALDLA